jgi:hypothetical protein
MDLAQARREFDSIMVEAPRGRHANLSAGELAEARFSHILDVADKIESEAEKSAFLKGPVTRFLQTDRGFERGSPEILENMKAVIGRLRPSEAGEYAKDTFNRELQFGLSKGRIDNHAAAKVLSNLEDKFQSPAVARSALREIVADAAEHADGFTKVASRFGAGGKIFAAAVGATIAGATGANASEVGEAAVNAAVPGLGTAAFDRHKGWACRAFGQVAGAGAGVAAGIGVTAGTSLTGPVAVAAGIGAGVATEAAVTPAAEAACNVGARFIQKLGF